MNTDCRVTQRLASWMCLGLMIGLCWIERSTIAQEEFLPAAISPELTTLDDSPQRSKRWLLLVCGLPGDDEHRIRLTKSTLQIALNGSQVFGIADAQRTVLVGDEQMAGELSAELPECRVATLESIAESIAALSQQIHPRDTCCVFLLGHGNLYGKSSYFNLSGRDLEQVRFSELASQLHCQHKLFWIGMPGSGYWLRPLAAENVVTISATEAAFEITGTEMPYALGDVLAAEAQHQQLEDIDKDGRLSVRDLYLAVNIEITARFAAIERLQTEHAQLDDDGDGRGRELQADYLPVDPRDEQKFARRPVVRSSIRDGQLSSTILIAKP